MNRLQKLVWIFYEETNISWLGCIDSVSFGIFLVHISMEAMRNLQNLSFTNLPWLDVCFSHFVFAAHELKLWNFHSTKIYNDNNIKTVYYCWSQATVAGYWRLIEIYSARQVFLSRCVCACMIACSMLIQPNNQSRRRVIGK